LFRHFHLKIGKLELGAPLPEPVLSATGARPGDTTLELPPLSFGKAKKITLHLTRAGLLESANFEYNSDADFETMIGDYKSLGAPARESSTRGGVTIDVARWSDDDTELTLTRESNGSASRLRSELRDRRAASR
jgi:hypothetical protein